MGQKPSSERSLGAEVGLSVRVQKRYVPYLPPYTNHAAAISHDTMATAKAHWLKILEGTSAFKAHRESLLRANKPCEPISFFYDAFFGELYRIAPNTRDIFKGQLVRQGKALIGMFTWMVNLDLTQSASELAGRLETLADRHVDYGCNPGHYDSVGQATFHALRVCSGQEDWTVRVQDAWVDILSIFLLVMVPRTVIKMEEQGLPCPPPTAATSSPMAGSFGSAPGGASLGLTGGLSTSGHSLADAGARGAGPNGGGFNGALSGSLHNSFNGSRQRRESAPTTFAAPVAAAPSMSPLGRLKKLSRSRRGKKKSSPSSVLNNTGGPGTLRSAASSLGLMRTS
ncbi:unnamed protein product, partial [Phaeothamnion confervicola]